MVYFVFDIVRREVGFPTYTDVCEKSRTDAPGVLNIGSDIIQAVIHNGLSLPEFARQAGEKVRHSNPVSTDAVGTAVMGYENPRAVRGVKPFHFCDNHLLMAEDAGLGTTDLAQIDLRGVPIEKARYQYG